MNERRSWLFYSKANWRLAVTKVSKVGQADVVITALGRGGENTSLKVYRPMGIVSAYHKATVYFFARELVMFDRRNER